MTEIARVIHPEEKTTSSTAKEARFVSLNIKALIVLFSVVLPLAIFVLIVAGFGIEYGLIVAVLLVGILAGLFVFDRFFLTPILSLRAWITDARQQDFIRVPILPPLHADEIGVLGKEMAATVGYLFEMREESKDFVQQKSQFVTIAAHQLRTPLTGLIWSIELLLDPKVDAESKQRVMPDIGVTLKRLQLIVNNILASADIEEGRFGYVFEKIDLVVIIDKLIHEFMPLATDRGISIAFNHEQNIPLVYADAERISLALFNIIGNAVDYTPQGGKIFVSVIPREDHVEISVEDTGIGIPEAELPFLFGKFFRGESAKHMRPDGSGLGLYLSKNIIGTHGSDISITSDPIRGGSRFSFFLKMQKPEWMPATASEKSKPT